MAPVALSPTFDRIFGGSELESPATSARGSSSSRTSCSVERQRAHPQGLSAGLLRSRRYCARPRGDSAVAACLSPGRAGQEHRAFAPRNTSRSPRLSLPGGACASPALLSTPRWLTQAVWGKIRPVELAEFVTLRRITSALLRPGVPGSLADIDRHAGAVRCFRGAEKHVSSPALRPGVPGARSRTRDDDAVGNVGAVLGSPAWSGVPYGQKRRVHAGHAPEAEDSAVVPHDRLLYAPGRSAQQFHMLRDAPQMRHCEAKRTSVWYLDDPADAADSGPAPGHTGPGLRLGDGSARPPRANDYQAVDIVALSRCASAPGSLTRRGSSRGATPRRGAVPQRWRV